MRDVEALMYDCLKTGKRNQACSTIFLLAVLARANIFSKLLSAFYFLFFNLVCLWMNF